MFRSDQSHWAVLRNLAISSAAVVVSTAAYYALPIGLFGIMGTWIFVVAFALGLSGVAILIAREVQRYRLGGGASITRVVVSLYLAVLFFASIYYGLSVHKPTSITSLTTKTDALYFALSISSTVGFGDIHAVSQLARAIVTVHMAFNIGYIGVAVTVLRLPRPRTE